MKTVADALRQPLVIGAYVLSVFIVGGAYVGSRWFYGDVEPIDIPVLQTVAPRPEAAAQEVNFEGIDTDNEHTQSESEPTVPPVQNEPVDDFLASLSDEERALLASEVVPEPERVSPFGFGPYPQVPSSYPEDVIWEGDMDQNIAQFGSKAMKAAELMDRILIKLWKQGHRATSVSTDSNGTVYPAFPNTVYVEWDYIEEEDGTPTRYASTLRGYPGMPDSVFDDVVEGIIPPGITVLDHNSDGIDPYTFLNLNP